MTYLRNPPTIPSGSITWTDSGPESDPACRLVAHVNICGVDMHLEAWEVEKDEPQTVRDVTMRTDAFDAVADTMDCRFETATIGGREYVLIATPYGV